MQTRKKLKAKGQRGSWFAEVQGELLPCVHKHWWKEGHYHDPNVQPQQKQWIELIESIRSKKRVILTDDKVLDGGIGFERTNYIAVFAIEDVEVGADYLRFRFTDRLFELQ